MAISLLNFVILALTTCEICTSESATIECGTIGNILDLVAVRISRGEKTIRGEWPFLTALFRVNEDENAFFCGGSLISSKHVLTAAHCIQDKGKAEKLLSGTISVVLGAYNLTSKTETGVERRNVQEIYVHPEWDAYNDKYDADLAILLLNEFVLFTDYIRPVCLPANDMVLEGVQGYVVGWGSTENGTRPNTEFIKRAAVTALDSVYCLTNYSTSNIASISSTRTFCGQGTDGNANRGDSGGGFYVENKEKNDNYLQRGIVSSLRTTPSGHVDPDLVVVYTNVAKFIDWIADTTYHTALNLRCVFGYGKINHQYICLIDNMYIRSDNAAVATISGSHRRRKTDRDVEHIIFRNGTMFFVPSGIGQTFKNVKIMEIQGNLNLKRIKRSDFKNLENLVELSIFKNEIEALDYDSLRDLQQLEVFQIKENKLTEIEEGTFDTNLNLKKVNVIMNRLDVLPKHLFRTNLLLEILFLHNNFLRIIDGTSFETNINLKRVDLNGNKLEVLPEHLFRNNSLLELAGVWNNSLKIVDESIFEMNINLKRVDLGHNKFEVLPRHLFRNNVLLDTVSLNNNHLGLLHESTFETNINLKSAYLNHNNFEILPRHLFRNNVLLDTVTLNNNHLSMLHESTFETNINLKKAYLEDNKLEVLPEHLFRNNLLLELVALSSNSMKIIDESMFEMNINLKKVFLFKNIFETLPKALFRNNLLLETIGLWKNFLSTIDESTFERNEKLKEVDLHDNKLEVLPRHLFHNNPLLEMASLWNNSLIIIDESMFEMNINLKIVYLNENKLEFLPRHLFRNNLLLEEVYLNNNRFRIIEIDFTSLKNIKEVFFQDNICIDANYKGDAPGMYCYQCTNLMEFQNLIRTNCSSPNP